MFELKLKNNTIHLKWGTWAMREFCLKHNIGIDKYFELLSTSQFNLDLIVQMVYIGYKSACASRKEDVIYTEVDACDWIDEIGSIFVTEGQLVDYIKYIVSSTVTTVQGANPKEEEKKKSKKANVG